MVINYAEGNDQLSWEVLRRNGGGPVSMDQVPSLFVELLEHEDGVCGKCDWVQEAQPDKVLRSAQYCGLTFTVNRTDVAAQQIPVSGAVASHRHGRTIRYEVCDPLRI